MPQTEKSIFESMYHLTKAQVVEEVYRNQAGSRYIASFAQFLSHVDGFWKDTLIKRVFREFVQLRILKYKSLGTLPVVFVGSIAYHYRSYLEDVLLEFDIHAGLIIKQPIHQLIQFHFNDNP